MFSVSARAIKRKEKYVTNSGCKNCGKSLKEMEKAFREKRKQI
jgi:dissimilatory sulfite reductase (desulfoviridin) alpha/beta subunit